VVNTRHNERGQVSTHKELGTPKAKALPPSLRRQNQQPRPAQPSSPGVRPRRLPLRHQGYRLRLRFWRRRPLRLRVRDADIMCLERLTMTIDGGDRLFHLLPLPVDGRDDDTEDEQGSGGRWQQQPQPPPPPRYRRTHAGCGCDVKHAQHRIHGEDVPGGRCYRDGGAGDPMGPAREGDARFGVWEPLRICCAMKFYIFSRRGTSPCFPLQFSGRQSFRNWLDRPSFCFQNFPRYAYACIDLTSNSPACSSR